MKNVTVVTSQKNLACAQPMIDAKRGAMTRLRQIDREPTHAFYGKDDSRFFAAHGK